MRRETRNPDTEKNKSMMYLVISVLALAILAFVITFVVYSNRAANNGGSNLDSGKIAELVPNNTNNTQSEEASSSMGKNVEESKNEMNAVNNTTNTTGNTTDHKAKTENNTVKGNSKKEQVNQTNAKEQKETKQEDPTFSKPVEGDTIREYAKDNLIFSQTLNEWVTHQGIDIKADKTTVVKAAADGKVKAIKNDPRYGLTVVIEHANGYVSVYSNLLTSEFVVESEEVKQGQTIATVGNTAAFEIADESHLHFEILKDNVAIDPNSCLK